MEVFVSKNCEQNGNWIRDLINSEQAILFPVAELIECYEWSDAKETHLFFAWFIEMILQHRVTATICTNNVRSTKSQAFAHGESGDWSVTMFLTRN
jgi:hypothetical protein